jgi:hypothetical protein
MTMKRRLVIVVLGVVVVGISATIWAIKRANDRKIEEVASGLVDCPRDRIDLVSSDDSDTGETYTLRACGRDVTLVCNAPDYVCFVAM